MTPIAAACGASNTLTCNSKAVVARDLLRYWFVDSSGAVAGGKVGTHGAPSE